MLVTVKVILNFLNSWQATKLNKFTALKFPPNVEYAAEIISNYNGFLALGIF